MPSDTIYITETLLTEIKEEVVNNLKTAYSYSKITSAVDTSSIPLPAIPPDTEPPDPIIMPIFEEVTVKDITYEKVNYYSGCPEDPDQINFSGTSAYPGPNTMSAIQEDTDNIITLSNLSIQECMIVAASNSIIKSLVEDNKLLYNYDMTKRFKWYVQNQTITATFNSSTDYPYWSFDSDTKYRIENLSNDELNPVTLPAGLPAGYSFKLSQHLSYDNLAKLVLKGDGSYHDLQKSVTIEINSNVDYDNIRGCNILAYNRTWERKVNINNYNMYVTPEGIRYIEMMITNPYEVGSFDDDGNKSIIFDLSIQYFYN